jgi:hypothetical protein
MTLAAHDREDRPAPDLAVVPMTAHDWPAERVGLRVVGTDAPVGRMTDGPMAGLWRPVVLVERRSEVAGA